MADRSHYNPFYNALYKKISELGGMHNAHLHLDRSETLDESFMKDSGHKIIDNSHISLHEKHALINSLHAGPAYETQSLRDRVNNCLNIMVSCDTRRADTLVDVTADRVAMSALNTLLEIKSERAGSIDLQVAAYSPLGFRDSDHKRWDIFYAGAEKADFVAALPEADDVDDYPDHIGFMEHCRRTLELASEKKCIIHVHTDQRNEPSETGTERLIEAVAKFGGPVSKTGETMIWAIHMISPSTYDEDRFERLTQNLVEQKIGVICCPSAAIGMRQLRPLKTPTFNSVPRVLELLAAGVEVRLASDNIADICSPSTTADLVDEIFILSAAIRFYQIDILAKLACGVTLDDSDRAFIRSHLEQDKLETEKVLRDTKQFPA